MQHNLFLKGILFFLILGSGASPAWGQLFQAGDLRPEAAQGVTVSVVVDEQGSSFLFDWGEKNPALALVRGLARQDAVVWWVVFDDIAPVSLPDEKSLLPGVRHIDTVPSRGGVVLQIVADSNWTPMVAQEGHKWRIFFKPQPLALQESAPIQWPRAKKDGLGVSLKEGGKEVRFKDPHTGYLHVVFPSRQMGFGMAKGYSFPDFHISAMAQGVGFQLLKEGLVVTAASGQVSVTHPEGLVITFPQERDKGLARTFSTGLFGGAKDLDWQSRVRKINRELLDLPHDQHGPGELEIAWLLLAYGETAEALGYLAHLAQMRPSIADVPLFKALCGVGNLLLCRFSESEHLLSAVSEEPEIQVWLSLAHALQRPLFFAKASPSLAQLRSHFQVARLMGQGYPDPLRRQMVTLVLKACIAIGDFETLASFIDQETRPENGMEREVFDLARASVLLGQNKPDGALQRLGELMERAVSAEVRDMALFLYVTHRLETNMMGAKEALPQLENLCIRWRGGWLGHHVMAYLRSRKQHPEQAKASLSSEGQVNK